MTKLLQKLGPGLLFAGAAVGVSHLVQATRAGAEYGFALLWVVILIHLFKYPFFEFGPRYASSTGESLLHGYRRMGMAYLVITLVLTIGTMFAIQAAVTIVTAGIAMGLFGLSGSATLWSGIILVLCFLMLIIGKYSTLDKVMKYVVIGLTIATLISVFIAFGNANQAPTLAQAFPIDDKVGLLFLITLMGWMPAPIDLAVWHSVWAIEKQKATTNNFNLKAALFDFNIGYIGTCFLAIFFLALGALVMYGSGEVFSNKGAVFSGQLISLYTKNFGDWSQWLIGAAALTVMFSTTITCLDAMPRIMSLLTRLLISKKPNEQERQEILDNTQHKEDPALQSLYRFWSIVLIIGTLVLLGFFITSMKQMITIATVLSFLTTPFFAFANFRLITGKHTPTHAHPKKGLVILSWAGLVFLTGFAGLYLWSLYL